MEEHFTYQTVFSPEEDLIKPLDHGLHEFNVAELGEEVIMDYHTLAVLARDTDGNIIGGIHGELIWEWFYIKTLWVRDDLRGYAIGSKLLHLAEEAAASKGFQKTHLETTSFQAVGFYLKHDYEIFGELEGKPTGTTWYFLKKDKTGTSADDLRDF